LTKGERSGKTGEQVKKVEEYCKQRLASKAVIVSAQIESELVDLPEAEGKEYLAGLGVQESGVGALIRATYDLLGLRTYLTTGPKESRAWTIHAGDRAPQAAGVIHTDFERGFIAAETVAFADLKAAGTMGKVREAGKLRVEGKEYVVQDGDVMEFRFNV
jgi:ribosome-binding ATPase YchF (GTP1/OBG family)